MSRFIEGANRHQSTLFPESLDVVSHGLGPDSPLCFVGFLTPVGAGISPLLGTSGLPEAV